MKKNKTCSGQVLPFEKGSALGGFSTSKIHKKQEISNKTLPVILFLGLTTLVGCGKPPAKTGGTATTPAPQPVLPTVHLRASDKGNISQMDVHVILPAGTTKNLLDYNGQATLKGTLSSSTLPCLQGSRSFSCKVQLSVGNIRAQNCSVGGQPISMLIVLLRGQKIKESYSIASIQANAGMSCFLPNTH